MPLSQTLPAATLERQAQRLTLMRLCAAATAEELNSAVASLSLGGPIEDIRPAEIGLVMLRGRTGGSGAPFNVGEATVSRAAVRLASGETGYGYLLGRDIQRARLAAIVDAAGQNARLRQHVERHLRETVTERVASQTRKVKEETAATRVNFFTMVRGED